MNPETIKTFKVAVALCLTCSILVSGLAVALDSTKKAQKEAFRQQNVLEAAGLWEEGGDPGAMYKSLITPAVLDMTETPFDTDEYDEAAKQVDLEYQLRTTGAHKMLDPGIDVAGLRKLESYSVVYKVIEEAELKTLVLPIRGKGLWSTLYGFIAIDMTNASQGSDALKVVGLTYYQHGETPGLGGEVENKGWKAKWVGKSVFDDAWNVRLQVAKNAVDEKYDVDSLSGATLTSNGVTNMLAFWLGENGYGPYLQKLTGGKTPAEPAADTDNETDASSGKPGDTTENGE